MNFYDLYTGKVKDFCLASLDKDTLEAYNEKLQTEGLNNEIDWIGVKNDFEYMAINWNNTDKIKSKVDYITSRYAVLKNRIETTVDPEQQQDQMEQLSALPIIFHFRIRSD